MAWADIKDQYYWADFELRRRELITEDRDFNKEFDRYLNKLINSLDSVTCLFLEHSLGKEDIFLKKILAKLKDMQTDMHFMVGEINNYLYKDYNYY